MDRIEQLFNEADVKFLSSSYVAQQLNIPEKDAEFFLKVNPKVREAHVVTEEDKTLYALKNTPIRGKERLSQFLKNIHSLVHHSNSPLKIRLR